MLFSKIILRKTPFRYDIDVQVNIRNLSKERCLWALKHKAPARVLSKKFFLIVPLSELFSTVKPHKLERNFQTIQLDDKNLH